MIAQGTPQMIPALSRIWETCFGDSPEYIRFFMERRFSSCRCFVWLEGEEPVGAAYLLPCTLGGRPAYYGYAVGVCLNFSAAVSALRSCAPQRTTAGRRGRCFLSCLVPEWKNTIWSEAFSPPFFTNFTGLFRWERRCLGWNFLR